MNIHAIDSRPLAARPLLSRLDRWVRTPTVFFGLTAALVVGVGVFAYKDAQVPVQQTTALLSSVHHTPAHDVTYTQIIGKDVYVSSPRPC